MLPVETRTSNPTEVDYPREKSIGQLFEEQVGRTPRAVALISGAHSLTFVELEARANRLARHLRQLEVGPEILVAVAVDRSLDLIVALLAVLKAGGAYVPLDPGYPPQRLADVIADSQAPVLLTTARHLTDLPKLTARVILIDSDSAAIAAHSSGPLDSSVREHNLAYVIYTSGSTGKPKGVMVEHRNVVNFFTGMDRAIGSDPGVLLAVTSVAFDISALELLWTLTRGFTVVLHGGGGAQTMAAEVVRHKVTHLQSTPSLVRLMTMDPTAMIALGSLKKLFLGGEALPTALVWQLRNVFRGEMYNMYGPTETTIWSTTFLLGEHPTTIPIGRPIANTQAYILDSDLQPVPFGEVGTLYIGGHGVVRGYFRKLTLTAERFLPDPFIAGNRMYNTGDLARLLSDGNIEYLGRTDFQIKIRGYRVELGEIEAALEKHSGVRQAVVVVREDKPDDKRLVAYVVLESSLPARVTGSELRAALGDKLPHYMVPARVVFLENIPLTANGKIDRNALPSTSFENEADIATHLSQRRPRNEIESVIEQVWKEALGVDRIGLDDRFCDLGAHSLLVAEVHVKLQERLQREISLVELFQYPTVAALAKHLGGETLIAGDPISERAQRRLAARQGRVPR